MLPQLRNSINELVPSSQKESILNSMESLIITLNSEGFSPAEISEYLRGEIFKKVVSITK